jgi:hypothetical protein
VELRPRFSDPCNRANIFLWLAATRSGGRGCSNRASDLNYIIRCKKSTAWAKRFLVLRCVRLGRCSAGPPWIWRLLQELAWQPSGGPKLWTGRFQSHSRMKWPSVEHWKPPELISSKTTGEGKAYAFGSPGSPAKSKARQTTSSNRCGRDPRENFVEGTGGGRGVRLRKRQQKKR